MTKTIDPILANILGKRTSVKTGSSIPLVGQEQPTCNVSPELKSKADGVSAKSHENIDKDIAIINKHSDPAIKNLSTASIAGGYTAPHGERVDFGLIDSQGHEGVDYSTGELNRGVYPFSTPKEASFLKRAEIFTEMQNNFVTQLAQLLKKAEELPPDLGAGVPNDVPPEEVAAAMGGAGMGAENLEEPQLSPEEQAVLQQIVNIVQEQNLDPSVLDMVAESLMANEGGEGGEEEPLINDPAAGGEEDIELPPEAVEGEPKIGSINLNDLSTQQLAAIVTAMNAKTGSDINISPEDAALVEQIMGDSLANKRASDVEGEEPELTSEEIEDLNALSGAETEEDQEAVKTAAVEELQQEARNAVLDAFNVKQAKLKAKTPQQDKKANDYSQVLESFTHRNNI
jgi:hypothetical protein